MSTDSLVSIIYQVKLKANFWMTLLVSYLFCLTKVQPNEVGRQDF